MRFDPVNLRKHRTDVRRTEDYDCGRSFKKKRALRDPIEPVTVKTDLLSAICAALSLNALRKIYENTDVTYTCLIVENFTTIWENEYLFHTSANIANLNCVRRAW
jgi:hypothetical protein